MTVENVLFICFYLIPEDDEDDGVRLAPSSADDAPRNTNSLQATSGSGIPDSSRPLGHVVGIIKRNWHS